MFEVEGTRNVSVHANDDERLREWLREPCDDEGRGRPLAPLPVPAVAPDEFVVRLGEGWGGSIHDLADGMEIFGTSEAARVLLSFIGFVEAGVRGLEGSDGHLERLGLLRGAVMSAGTAVRLPGIGIMMDSGRWDGEYLKRLGR